MKPKRLPSTVTGKIHRFFLANPDEELTIQDIRDKFDCTDGAIRQALRVVPGIEYARVVRLKAKGVAQK